MSKMLAVGTRVRITHLSDRELLKDERTGKCEWDRFVGKCGVITGIANDKDPGEVLYKVHCRRAGDDAFWSDELEVLA